MYINLGNAYCIKAETIVGVFDFESSTISKRTRNFLNLAQKKDEIVNIGFDLPKSFVVAESENKQTVYLSPLSTATILKRMSNIREGVKV